VSKREPLIVEGPLRECGDGCECSWLTLNGVMLDALLPETPWLNSDSQCATIAVEWGHGVPHRRHVGEVEIHDVPRWDLERRRGHEYDHVFRDWGRVRVTIEWIEEA